MLHKQRLLCLVVARSSNASRMCYTNTKNKYLELFITLDLPSSSSRGEVRRKYIELAKKFHPDTNNAKEDEDKFNNIDKAYRALQRKFKEDQILEDSCVGEYGLYYTKPSLDMNEEEEGQTGHKHTVPQHRQFLVVCR